MVNYSLPQDLITQFAEVAASNIKGRNHVETLAYLVGYEDNDTLYGTHLVFPKQKGTASKVDDEGNDFMHDFTF